MLTDAQKRALTDVRGFIRIYGKDERQKNWMMRTIAHDAQFIIMGQWDQCETKGYGEAARKRRQDPAKLPELWQDVIGFMDFGIARGMGAGAIISNIGHDMNGLLNPDVGFSPRTRAYRKYIGAI